jgi:hypothetical protein
VDNPQFWDFGTFSKHREHGLVVDRGRKDREFAVFQRGDVDILAVPRAEALQQEILIIRLLDFGAGEEIARGSDDLSRIESADGVRDILRFVSPEQTHVCE